MGIRYMIGDQIAVRPVISTETASGIALPTEQDTHRGVVVAAGPGQYVQERDEEGKIIKETDEFVHMAVNVGDTVVYPKEAGEEMEVDGEKLYIIREGSVLAVILEE